jgi:hypothetical protein
MRDDIIARKDARKSGHRQGLNQKPSRISSGVFLCSKGLVRLPVRTLSAYAIR